MIVGVNADLVAVFRHAPDKGLLTLDAVAHQEEGGLDLPESQTVQQAGGGGGSGAVVKGESHQGGLLRHRHRPAAPCLCGWPWAGRHRAARSSAGTRTRQYLKNFFLHHMMTAAFPIALTVQYVRFFRQLAQKFLTEKMPSGRGRRAGKADGAADQWFSTRTRITPGMARSSLATWSVMRVFTSTMV